MNQLSLIRRWPLTTLSVLAWVLLAAPMALGQKTVANRPAPAQPVMPGIPDAARESWQQATISLDFPGGTLQEYIAAVRRAAGETPVNVSFAGGSERAQLPPVSFRGVQIETAIRAAEDLHEQIPGTRMRVEEITPEQRGMMMQRIGAPMYVIQIFNDATQRERISKVISLNRVIGAGPEALPAEVVLTAIDTALRNDGSGVDLKFHKDSGLLFVSGSERQCRLAAEVVEQLARDTDPKHDRSSRTNTQEFVLAHISPSDMVDVLRVAFPSRPDAPPDVAFVPEPAKNAILVTAPDSLLVAVRALVRFADIRPELNPTIADERVARDEARRRAEAAELAAQSMRKDTERLREESAKMGQAAVEFNAQKDFMARELHRAQDEIAKLRQQLDIARDQLGKVRNQEEASPNTPK